MSFGTGNPLPGGPVGEEEGDLPYFSYASPDDGPLKRLVIRAIEQMTGQPRLRAMYMHHRSHPRPGETFWAAAMRYLELDLDLDQGHPDQIPSEGPVVVVANHPFGVLDGIVVSYLVSTVRQDFKVLTNSVLYRAPEIRPYVLPIDFADSREAMQTNIASRAEARRLLKDGGVVVAFPGGTVSTADRPFGRAYDPEWKPFTARLIMEAQATVVPVFFAGQNSHLFQMASQISQTLRLSLLFREVADRIGTTLSLRIGDPIPFADLQHLSDRRNLATHLRTHTYELGAGMNRTAGRNGGRKMVKSGTTRKARRSNKGTGGGPEA